ncbi:MAG: OsmC family protein, partial [Bacillota bacterium]
MSKVSAVLYEDRIEYRDSEDQELVIDSEGASPMELLLMAVAGCSGLTLESLLERDGYTPDKVKLTVRGIISDKAPRRYTEINVDYDIVCEGLDT